MPSATRRTQGNRKQRRAEIERKLLDATERLMGEGLAFTELSVDRLATEAGISRANFYIYFEDKSQLLRTLAQHVFAEFTGQEWPRVAAQAGPADIRRDIGRIITTYRAHQALLTAVIEVAAYDPEMSATYDQLLDETIRGLETAIEQGKVRGEIRPELPTHETASALTWAVERTVHQMARRRGPEQDGQLADAFTQIVWATLYLQPGHVDVS